MRLTKYLAAGVASVITMAGPGGGEEEKRETKNNTTTKNT